jgi:hypothetical protein
MIGYTLGAAADLSVAFGREQVNRLADLWAIGPRFHIEGFDRARIAIDK